MITEIQFNKATKLIAARDKIEALLDSFERKELYSVVGIVQVNTTQAGKLRPTMQSDHADFFYNYFYWLMDELSDHARLKMQDTLKKINMELGEFIKPQPAHVCHFEASLADGETKICKCGNVE